MMFCLIFQNTLNPLNQYKSYFFHIETVENTQQSKLIHI